MKARSDIEIGAGRCGPLGPLRAVTSGLRTVDSCRIPPALGKHDEDGGASGIKRRPVGEKPNGPRRVGLEIAKADYT